MESEMKAAEGWEKYKVRDICELGRGRVISGQEIERNPGIFPVYSSQSSNNGKMGTIDTFDFDGEYVTWTTDGAYAGTVFYRSGHFNCTNVCGTLRAKDTRVCMSFLAYKLSTLAKGYVSYVGNPKLMNGVMADIEFSIPISKLEQTKIAEILSTVDRAIEQTEALIAKQQRIKTGLMQDLLTRGIDKHGNLRSEQTHRFKDSALGRIPVEWEVQPLGNALHKAKGFLQTGPFGSQLHANEYVQEGIPVIMPQDIFEGCVLEIMIARIPKNRAEDLRKHRVQVNDIVFSRRGDLSRTAVIGDREVGWLCGTGCFLLRASSNEMDTHWLADLYQHHLTQRQIETNAVGSTMPSLNNTVMEQLTMAFPSLEEQHEITCRWEATDRNISAIRNHLLKLRSLKTALMQDLLTGKKRVWNYFDELSTHIRAGTGACPYGILI